MECFLIFLSFYIFIKELQCNCKGKAGGKARGKDLNKPDRYGHRDHLRFLIEYWRWSGAEGEAESPILTRPISFSKIRALLKGLRVQWNRKTLPFNQKPDVNLS